MKMKMLLQSKCAHQFEINAKKQGSMHILLVEDHEPTRSALANLDWFAATIEFKQQVQ